MTFVFTSGQRHTAQIKNKSILVSHAHVTRKTDRFLPQVAVDLLSWTESCIHFPHGLLICAESPGLQSSSCLTSSKSRGPWTTRSSLCHTDPSFHFAWPPSLFLCSAERQTHTQDCGSIPHHQQQLGWRGAGGVAFSTWWPCTPASHL
ncbi:uncharacterized protein LOC118599628 isoform X2 [Oryzias melastigma]|uniref:uncharacterized protein LOC118599628 isoform X2 n=1 Tax=Oryzias melastigma TaxID=30732 RepID=UPI00168CC4D0|nr:uncharacterized protein LOC118599628 isoform X2 [Oryzias melastigma]